MALIVCPTCRGRGVQTLHGIAMTADEVADQGPDFIDDMLAGMYDHPCDTCAGRNVVDEDEYRMMMEDAAVYRMESGGW